MHTALIRLQDVSLGYDGRAVLEHVSFAIERREFLALLGPNGGGKTTILRSVLGLTPVLAGRIEYGFDRLTSPPGYVPLTHQLQLVRRLARSVVWVEDGRAHKGPATSLLAPESANPFQALRGSE
jgi:ABC-type Mn2+/Zn2+ transport system ATPase subunit